MSPSSIVVVALAVSVTAAVDVAVRRRAVIAGSSGVAGVMDGSLNVGSINHVYAMKLSADGTTLYFTDSNGTGGLLRQVVIASGRENQHSISNAAQWRLQTRGYPTHTNSRRAAD